AGRECPQLAHPPVAALFTRVPADPVEHHIARQHPEQAKGQRKPPPGDTLVAQHGGRDDRHFLGDWHSQAPEQEYGKNAEVRKVVDEFLKCLHGVLASNGSRTRVRRQHHGRPSSEPDLVPTAVGFFVDMVPAPRRRPRLRRAVETDFSPERRVSRAQPAEVARLSREGFARERPYCFWTMTRPSAFAKTR